MICALIESLFDLYLDNRLMPFQARWVESHLASCPVCAARLALCKKILRELRTLSTPPVPAAFKAELRTALLNAKKPAYSPDFDIDTDFVPRLQPSLSFAFSFLAFMLFISGSVFGPGIPTQSCSDSTTSICAAKPPMRINK